MALYRGCCSSGPAGGFGEEGAGSRADPALFDHPSPISIAALGPPPGVAPYPFAELFAISVAAGLTIHWLTKRRK